MKNINMKKRFDFVKELEFNFIVLTLKSDCPSQVYSVKYINNNTLGDRALEAEIEELQPIASPCGHMCSLSLNQHKENCLLIYYVLEG